MLLITKVETECLVKEKLDQSEAHELLILRLHKGEEIAYVRQDYLDS